MVRALYILACLAGFAVGAYVWKIQRTGEKEVDPVGEEPALAGSEPEESPLAKTLPSGIVLYKVGRHEITSDDIEWEFQLHTAEIFDTEELTPIPDLGVRYREELSPLKRRLAAALIERKLLFEYVGMERGESAFDSKDSSRYTDCLKEWQETLAIPSPLWDGSGKERLKSRLCETSLIEQYLAERVFSGIKVSEKEIFEYYKDHPGKFRVPEKVEIRQILLPSERDARKVRAVLNRQNFADVAREHSIAPEAENGGLLGPFSRGEMPAVFNIAFSMRTGQISDIMKSTYGYHLIMLEKKHPARVLSLEDATPEIREILLARKKEAAYRAWVEKALAAITVTSPKPLW